METNLSFSMASEYPHEKEDYCNYKFVFNDGDVQLLPNTMALSNQSIKTIHKNISNRNIKSTCLNMFLRKCKQSGTVVFYPRDVSTYTQITMACLYNILNDKSIFCQKHKQTSCPKVEDLSECVFQINKSKLILPMSELSTDVLMKGLKAAVQNDFKNSIDRKKRLLETATNIGKLSSLYKYGSKNLFRTIGTRRVLPKCGRAVISPSPNQKYVYLPVNMFCTFFGYNINEISRQTETILLIRYPTIKRGQIINLRARAWKHDTIAIPTMITDLYGADFDGDTVAIIPITDPIAAIHATLDLSLYFNVYTSQVNLFPAPASRLFINMNFKNEFLKLTQQGIINLSYRDNINLIHSILYNSSTYCNNNTQLVTLRNIFEYTGVISQLNVATRFTKLNHEQITKSIGFVQGSISKEEMSVVDNFQHGVSRSQIFEFGRLCRESVVQSKIGLSQEGEGMTNSTYKNETYIVNHDFSVSYLDDVISFTPLSLLSNVINPCEGFLPFVYNQYIKILK